MRRPPGFSPSVRRWSSCSRVASRPRAKLPVPTNGSDPQSSVSQLRELLDALPEELAATVFTHASWTTRRADSYERLAFLGDSVLGLAVTTHLFPRLDAERFGPGRLTKVRAQAVSGRSCRTVAERVGVPGRLRA